MKTLKLTLAAVVLSAFTMTAQKNSDSDATVTKTEISKEVKEEVRAPHKLEEQKRQDQAKAATKTVPVNNVTSQDSEVAKTATPAAPATKAKKAATKKAAVKTIVSDSDEYENDN